MHAAFGVSLCAQKNLIMPELFFAFPKENFIISGIFFCYKLCNAYYKVCNMC